jgi:hypothetical protein
LYVLLATTVPPLNSFTAVIPVRSLPVPVARKTMSFKATLSPLVLVTATWKTDTFKAPGICVELDGSAGPRAIWTTGWVGVEVAVLVALLVAVAVEVFVAVFVAVSVPVPVPVLVAVEVGV